MHADRIIISASFITVNSALPTCARSRANCLANNQNRKLSNVAPVQNRRPYVFLTTTSIVCFNLARTEKLYVLPAYPKVELKNMSKTTSPPVPDVLGRMILKVLPFLVTFLIARGCSNSYELVLLVFH